MASTLDDERCDTTMPFHEKVAWLTLASAGVIYGGFLSTVLATPAAKQSVLNVAILFAVAITSQGVATAIARPLLALRSPEDAKAPLDERDRGVARGAFKAAYLALIACVVILAMAVPAFQADWQLTLAAFFTAILADIVRMAAVIVGYRRRNA